MRHRKVALAAGKDVQAAEHGRPDEVAVGVWSSAVEAVAVGAWSHEEEQGAVSRGPSPAVPRVRRRPHGPVARLVSRWRGPPGSSDTSPPLHGPMNRILDSRRVLATIPIPRWYQGK